MNNTLLDNSEKFLMKDKKILLDKISKALKLGWEIEIVK
jgi:hypothetical protein